MKFLTVLFLFVFSYPLKASIPESDEQFLIAVNSNLLNKFLQQSISESRPIYETVQGTLMQGTALTTGKVSAGTYPSTNGLGLSIFFDSSTNACTLNLNKPRPDIGIEFNWTIATRAATRKDILLKESGFSLYQARTNAKSEITIQDIDVVAEGLFKRLKSRIAMKKALETLYSTKSKNEQDAAKRIAQELNSMVDERAYTQLLPIHNKYYTYFYKPFVLDGLLGGRVSLGSNESWMAILGTKGEKLQALDVNDVSAIQNLGNEPPAIVVRLDESFLERLGTLRFGGMEISESEMGELFGRKSESDDPKEEMVMLFDDEKPFTVHFDKNTIQLGLRVQELSWMGKKYNNVILSRRIEIITDNAGNLLLQSLPHDLPIHFDGSAMEKQTALAIQEHLKKNLPQKPMNLSERTLFTGDNAMRIKNLTAEKGKITLGVAP